MSIAELFAQGGPVMFAIAAASVLAWGLIAARLLDARGTNTRDLDLIAALATICPLLGLLGTVLGMLETFRAIAIHGTGEPGAIAGGVSQALLTTETGLVAALAILPVHAWISARARARG